MKRRRAEESADGLALMTSSVMSSYSADGLREQSQESAAIAKRCRLHKLIRQRFALALKIQQMLFALITSRKIPAGSICLIPAGQPDASNSSIQSCRLHKLIRQRFALALKIQQMLFALITSRKILSQEKPAGSNSTSRLKL
ncbi:disease resistance protein [Dorcoceras hygrometricum]|uniref:Disease resistance protein n=1 Tax=Dorcoceras hygrometricum TaxID=472368 RepID=A0A2Z7CBJ6_9LAMI|nr:disease resistance protein [Dorcoceras hygrometricum]